MTRFAPLPLHVVSAEWADRVPSPAHDALTGEQRQAFIADHPDSYLAVTQSHEDRPGSSADQMLRAGRQALDRLVERGAFGSEQAPAYYLYQLEQTVDGRAVHRQTGVVGGLAISDLDRGELRPHERIHAERAGHMAAHLDAVGVQSSPVAVAVRPESGLSPVIAAIEAASGPPSVVAHSPDGLVQRIWPVRSPSHESELTAVLHAQPTYLIDGHHRAAATALHRDHLERASGQPATDSAQWLLTVVFPADRLLNRPFHRRVLGTSIDTILDATGDRFAWRCVASATDCAENEVVLVDAEQIVAIALPRRAGSRSPDTTSPDGLERALDGLDVVRIDRWLLEDTLGLEPTLRDPRIAYVPGTGFSETVFDEPGFSEPGSVICLARPVPTGLILDVADAGLVLPPKSTYFEPKVRSGVFLRTL